MVEVLDVSVPGDAPVDVGGEHGITVRPVRPIRRIEPREDQGMARIEDEPELDRLDERWVCLGKGRACLEAGTEPLQAADRTSRARASRSGAEPTGSSQGATPLGGSGGAGCRPSSDRIEEPSEDPGAQVLRGVAPRPVVRSALRSASASSGCGRSGSRGTPVATLDLPIQTQADRFRLLRRGPAAPGTQRTRASARPRRGGAGRAPRSGLRKATSAGRRR